MHQAQIFKSSKLTSSFHITPTFYTSFSLLFFNPCHKLPDIKRCICTACSTNCFNLEWAINFPSTKPCLLISSSFIQISLGGEKTVSVYVCVFQLIIAWREGDGLDEQMLPSCGQGVQCFLTFPVTVIKAHRNDFNMRLNMPCGVLHLMWNCCVNRTDRIKKN